MEKKLLTLLYVMFMVFVFWAIDFLRHAQDCLTIGPDKFIQVGVMQYTDKDNTLYIPVYKKQRS